MTSNDTLLNKLNSELWYSVRRYYVDAFFSIHIDRFGTNAKILDLGGKKDNKRGVFNIENQNLQVEYANIDKNTNPDYLCDIADLPVEDNSFNGVILSEVLEHVPDPKTVLQEAYRILKPEGIALICTPFNFHIHADPYDYGRYTAYWYETVLNDLKFDKIQIEKQGLFFSVLANMIKLWVYELSKAAKPKSKLKMVVFRKFVFWFQKKAFKMEKDSFYRTNWLFSGYTTGYGIICEKKLKQC